VNLFEDNGAKFSEDMKHRLMLWRVWDKTKPAVMFIGLNPSTANENTDDPTIRRIKSISYQLGYGGFFMMNLFTFISTDPKKLNIKEGNRLDADLYLKRIAKCCKTIVFAWGNFDVLGRDKEVIEMFPGANALHINKNGSPKHPLYVKSNTQLISFIAKENR
jgi:hypothetical protein